MLFRFIRARVQTADGRDFKVKLSKDIRREIRAAIAPTKTASTG